MKTILLVIIASLGLPAHGAILAGPLVNPANGHSYYLLSQNTWSNAEVEAISLGGHLATIRNADEQHWVFSTFSTFHGALWIGLTDRDKVFTFTWTSGEPLLYTNWSDTEPDNGTGGIEYYTHMWPAGIQGTNPPPPGKWNDYANVNDLWGFPLYGVAEVSPATTVRVSLSAFADMAKAKPVANLAAAGSTGPELRAFTAIELIWPSETNKLYRIQWTPSLTEPEWLNLEPTVLGTGTNVSVFDSTREHPQGYYRVQIVQ
jgi:hypothetical protein